MKNKAKISDIGSIVINFLRPDVTIKCIKSLKMQTPDINIYVGDQDDNNAQLKNYCKENNINYIKLNFDCGIGVARNTLVESARKDGCKYIMWGDNDFVYDERFRVKNALNILDKDKKVGIVGGTILKNNIVQHYERVIYYNKFYQTACFIPLEYIYPKTYYANKIDYYYCDMTFNFCIARIEIFDKDVRWDDNIKVKFEHSFFFCKFLKHSKLRVAYCPSMMANHEHGRDDNYAKYRYRVSDGEVYAKKLKMKTGFAINDKSWNHVTQDFMNFRQVTSESPTYISALKYSLKNYENKNIQRVSNQFRNIHELLDFMICKDSSVTIMKNTCLEAVKTQDFSYDTKELFIGTLNPDNLKAILLNYGFNQVENKYVLNDYIVNIEKFDGRTKNFIVSGFNYKVPFPVIGYLQKIYGKNWENIDV